MRPPHTHQAKLRGRVNPASPERIQVVGYRRTALEATVPHPNAP
jgi:hypothetical protein